MQIDKIIASIDQERDDGVLGPQFRVADLGVAAHPRALDGDLLGLGAHRRGARPLEAEVEAEVVAVLGAELDMPTLLHNRIHGD